MFIDLPTIESLLVTFIITALRTLVEASPTILGGVVVAAWLRTRVTPERVQVIFHGTGLRGTFRTILVGMTLPVCSIGVWPVLRELRLLGLPTSKLITLGLVAPLLNPFSLLFGLTVLSLSQYLIMIAVGGLLAIVIGEISSRFAVQDEVTAVARPAGLTGGTRLRNLLIASSRLVSGRTVIDLLVTIVVSALTLSFIRSGAFYLLCFASNRGGPLSAYLLTITQYVSPSRGIIQFGGIEDANLATSTGLVIFVFGTAIGGASILNFIRWYGWRRILALSIAMFLVVLSVSYFSFYAVPPPLGDIAETAALDNLARPAYASFQHFDKAFEEAFAFVNSLMLFSSVSVLVLFITGLFVRVAKIDLRSDDPEAAARQNAGRMAKAIPASQLGAVAICGIGIVFCLSSYIFFPSPGEILQLMERDQQEISIAVRSGDRELAMERISTWDSSAASVPIGAAIRGSFPTAVQRKVTRDLRGELRKMREILVAGDLKTARAKLADLQRLLMETKNAFAGGST